jgi:hypothetical protein
MGKGGKKGREEKWKREGRNDRRRRLNVGKGRTGRKGKEREEKEREEKRSVPSLKSSGIYMAIQTPALFANTREYSRHGRVYLHIYGYGCSALGLNGERLTGCRNSGCRNSGCRNSGCRNSGCRNNDLYPYLTQHNLLHVSHRIICVTMEQVMLTFLTREHHAFVDRSTNNRVTDNRGVSC